MKLKISDPVIVKDEDDTIELYLEQDCAGNVCVISKNIRTNTYCLEAKFTPNSHIRTYHCDNLRGAIYYTPRRSNFKEGILSPF
jgi:hypothetical protein